MTLVSPWRLTPSTMLSSVHSTLITLDADELGCR
jgi:hypothetical protein